MLANYSRISSVNPKSHRACLRPVKAERKEVRRYSGLAKVPSLQNSRLHKFTLTPFLGWALDDITQKDLVREGLGNSFTIRSFRFKNYP